MRPGQRGRAYRISLISAASRWSFLSSNASSPKKPSIACATKVRENRAKQRAATVSGHVEYGYNAVRDAMKMKMRARPPGTSGGIHQGTRERHNLEQCTTNPEIRPLQKHAS